MASPYKRQAVMVIHGIGEQHPIVTLRGLVEPLVRYLKEIKKEARMNEPVCWSKPDPVSGNYETRQMTMRMGQHHPTTDFFEFYWAHHMRDTNWSHIKDWLLRVVLRNPSHVSPRLRYAYGFIWGLVLLVIIFCCWLGFSQGWTNSVTKIAAIFSCGVATLVLGLLSQVLFNTLGDAARYLDPSPGNVGERQKIREEGIALLKKLHESGEYDRIVILSHSLGTTIAYDLVKLLWAEYYKTIEGERFAEWDEEKRKHMMTLALASLDAAQLMETVYSDEESTNEARMESLKAYRAAQAESLSYLKSTGNKWLVSDLVTIACPLTHAGHLFAQTDGLFEKLKQQREYPVSPPLVPFGDDSFILRSKKHLADAADADSGYPYFNFSSPFAVTRWTNMHYSCDFVGGSLANFGKGIMNIEILKQSPWFMLPIGHTRYWDYDNSQHILGRLWDILEDKEQEL